MESWTSTSTANREADSMFFKSKNVVGINLECNNQNYIWVPDEDSIDLNCNIYGTTEYWCFYKKYISPSMIQSSHIPEQKPPEKSNKKKGMATSTIAMLIFLLMWFNGVCFWSFIFNLIIR